MEYVKVVLEGLLPYFAALVSSLLMVVGAWLVRTLQKKLGVELADRHDAMWARFVEWGVGRAEQWAASELSATGQRPSGAQKLQVALAFVIGLADKAGLPRKAEDELVELLEAALGVKRLSIPPASPERTALEFAIPDSEG